MKTAKPFYLREVNLLREKIPSFDKYPFCLPAVRHLDGLSFNPAVTYFVGENGSGKSTLLEALAVTWGFNAEGGSRNFKFTTRESHSNLTDYLRLVRGVQKPEDGYFLRAESFYNVATEVENLGVTGYGERSLHEQSHGESFWSLIMVRFWGNGLYILDEPEAALSPSRQMAMVARMHQLVKLNSQFIIATHSPIIMAYPAATVYFLNEKGIRKVKYTDTEHYRVSREFLLNPDGMLKILMEDSVD